MSILALLHYPLFVIGVSNVCDIAAKPRILERIM
jgi:hypothetical protein